MKKLIYLLIFCFCLLSCKSKDVLTKTEQINDIEVKKDIEETESKKVQESIKLKIEQQTDEETEVIIKKTVYDPDKPIDIETGKPPIKEEIETVINKKKKSEQKSEQKQEKQEVEEKSFVDNSEIKQKAKVNIKVEEDTPLSTIEIIFISLAIIASAVIIYKIYHFFR